jgi:hypothetical protein
MDGNFFCNFRQFTFVFSKVMNLIYLKVKGPTHIMGTEAPGWFAVAAEITVHRKMLLFPRPLLPPRPRLARLASASMAFCSTSCWAFNSWSEKKRLC